MRHMRNVGSYEPKIDNPRWMRRLEQGNKLWCQAFKKLIVMPGAVRAAAVIEKPLSLERVRMCEDCGCEANHCMCELPFPRRMFGYGREEMEEDLQALDEMSMYLSAAIKAKWIDGMMAIKAERRIQKMRQKCRGKLLAARMRMPASDDKRPFAGRAVNRLEQANGTWRPIKGGKSG